MVLYRPGESSRSTVPGGLSEKAWVGGSVMSGLRLFNPPHSFDVALLARSELLTVECAIAFEFAGGIHRPVWFRAFWAVDGGQWVLQQVSQSNTPFNRHVLPWMF